MNTATQFDDDQFEVIPPKLPPRPEHVQNDVKVEGVLGEQQQTELQSLQRQSPPPKPPRPQQTTTATCQSIQDPLPPVKPPRPVGQIPVSSKSDIHPQKSEEVAISGDACAESEERLPPYSEPPASQTFIYDPTLYEGSERQTAFLAPPSRLKPTFDDDLTNPIHITRNPHKVVGYLVPFPKPRLPGVDPKEIPTRFLIYTPAPPPLLKPSEGEKEKMVHKVQRKWQEEVRKAKTSDAKTASWQGVKSKAMRGINTAIGWTTTSNLDFLGRLHGDRSDSDEEEQLNDKHQEGDTTHKTVPADEIVLVYPPAVGLDEAQMREEFVNTLLRTKSKAQRDAIISTGLLPIAYGIDILCGPFGGLGEIDTVWAYASIRGAKTARSITKRLSSSSESGDYEKDRLLLNFTQSQRVELFRHYLEAECQKRDAQMFPGYSSAPTESDILEAIGWTPKKTESESKNWEDEQWEISEVKEDLKLVMRKGAREWKRWCSQYSKDSVKALKK